MAPDWRSAAYSFDLNSDWTTAGSCLLRWSSSFSGSYQWTAVAGSSDPLTIAEWISGSFAPPEAHPHCCPHRCPYISFSWSSRRSWSLEPLQVTSPAACPLWWPAISTVLVRRFADFDQNSIWWRCLSSCSSLTPHNTRSSKSALLCPPSISAPHPDWPGCVPDLKSAG